jgi:EmrB/QacA subfamily drug resistance transporter
MSTASSASKAPVVTHDRELEHGEIMVIMSALMLALLLGALDQTIVATALPKIANDLHGLSEYSWVATAYLLTSAVSTPIYGKISDMFGRKKIFQFSIILFLIGSALCGLSQTMTELIFFRGLQGLGAGGLMTLVFAIIGDVVPPRSRGRYQGYFGAVFAVASVIGPLLGGVLTDDLSWRWVFYVNIPLGIVALSAIGARLHLPVRHVEHRIDWPGASLLAISVTCLLLATVWGGVTYPWGSGQIVGLFGGAVVSALLFVWRERHAAEPVIPLRLFKNGIFSVTTLLSLLVGAIMFGAIIFLPEYQQLIRGDSPIKSGLMLMPLILGVVTASLTAGRLTSKLGRYRMFPIIGSILFIISLWLFSHIGVNTSRLVLGVWMVLLGIGVGQIMPILTLAVQNAVERKDLGTATSSVVFFRSIGSALGAAVFGAVLINRLTHYVLQSLPVSAGKQVVAGIKQSLTGTAGLPHADTTVILASFAHAFRDVFMVGLPLAVATLIVALFLKEAPLKTSTKEIAEGQGLEI